MVVNTTSATSTSGAWVSLGSHAIDIDAKIAEKASLAIVKNQEERIVELERVVTDLLSEVHKLGAEIERLTRLIRTPENEGMIKRKLLEQQEMLVRHAQNARLAQDAAMQKAAENYKQQYQYGMGIAPFYKELKNEI